MVFIPISVFAPVSIFHSEFKLQGLTQSRKTELKPFLANLGTRMRAGVIAPIAKLTASMKTATPTFFKPFSPSFHSVWK
jgi:hypothetical protein